MVISEKKIRSVLRQVIMEAVSKYVYHFTSIKSGVNILNSNRIYLTMQSNNGDAFSKDNMFYLSTQRSRNTREGYALRSVNHQCRIMLDGDKINQRFKGGPIDYWGPSLGKQSRPNGTGEFEIEDRIYSKDPVIENILDYIVRVDFLIKKESEYALFDNFNTSLVDRVVFIYDNVRDYNSQSENTISLDRLSGLVSASLKTNPNEEPARRNSESIYAGILAQLLGVWLLLNNKDDDESASEFTQLLTRFKLEKYAEGILRLGPEKKVDIILGDDSLVSALRKLNYQNDDSDSLNIMRLASYLLKHFRFTNFDEMFSIIQVQRRSGKSNGKHLNNDKTVEVIMYQPDGLGTITRASVHPDKTRMIELIPNLSYAASELAMFLGDNKIKMGSKSKDERSFINYFMRLWRVGSINQSLDFLKKVCYDQGIIDQIINGKIIYKSMNVEEIKDSDFSTDINFIDFDEENDFSELYIDSIRKLLKQHPELPTKVTPHYKNRPDVDRLDLLIYKNGELDMDNSMVANGEKVYQKLQSMIN